MEEKYYSAERNVQIIVSLLKQYGIKKVIASPGTTNMTFVACVMRDKWFDVISCVDERSAAYMACGMAAESGEPVVITCTGATASRNYLPAITEAYYRKLPVLAVTGARETDTYGSLTPQTIDRIVNPRDTYTCSVHLQFCHSGDDEWGNTLKVNKAILALSRNGGGPAHINVVTGPSSDYSVREIKPAKAIFRITPDNKFPEISKNKVAIYIGNHKLFSEKLTQAVDRFCEIYNAVVFCDNTSGYYGKYKILLPILSAQSQEPCQINHVGLLIHIGEISGSYMKAYPEEVWRISEDGELRDHFKKLKYTFQMSEEEFFEHFINGKDTNQKNDSFYTECQTALKETREKIDTDKIPFSNVWIASQLSPRIPQDIIWHVSILNSLRSWNYFDIPDGTHFQCNTGGFGIDGPISTLLGASFLDGGKLAYLISGDLAFFYDLNSLGNHYIRNNVRILLVNNGEGIEFKNHLHPACKFGDAANEFFAAKGHFGSKSKSLVREIANSLGFEYKAADNKEDFNRHIDWFMSPEIGDKPYIFEVFTNEEDEDVAIRYMNTLNSSVRGKVKDLISDVLSDSVKNKITAFIEHKK